MSDVVILGAGMSGLAAAIASGGEVYEAAARPGGLCATYYLVPGENRRRGDAHDRAYRFEIGGGHWIWGCEGLVERFVSSLVTLKSYARRAGVYIAPGGTRAPFPLQHHLGALGKQVAARALAEIVERAARPGSGETMRACLEGHFGPTLLEVFFASFQSRYTAGLWEEIAPEDAGKAPLNLRQVIGGALGVAPVCGYNATFQYPEQGLGALAEAMARRCQVKFRQPVVAIDAAAHRLRCAGGSSRRYQVMLSTLPLRRTVELAGVRVAAPPDPYVSVLVLNLGGSRGRNCPREHWMYVADSRSGFHRVGFYSNVDRDFLPRARRRSPRAVSLYVEKAYRGGCKPSPRQLAASAAAVVEELRAWGWLDTVEVMDPTWIEVAYTWRAPGSCWPEQAMAALARQGIYSLGRYGRWATGLLEQGLAQALAAGFQSGASLA